MPPSASPSLPATDPPARLAAGPDTPPSTLSLTVRRRRLVAEDVAELELASAGGAALPPWEPGAHVDLLLRPGLVRSYSLCGDPARTDIWRVAVLREPAGRGGSIHVHDTLTPGSVVEVRMPRNNFRLVDAQSYVFVAGGIGITPLLPMIAAADAARADWSLLYGGRRRGSMAYLDEVARYGRRVVVRPQDEYGLLDLPAAARHAAAVHALVYCCGPEPLLAAAAAAFPADRLHIERFSAAGRIEDATGSPFDVVLARRGRTVAVAPGTSVLAALEAAGVPVAQSCREGTCGACETPVLDGEPDHRDSVLDTRERAAGRSMMICVSRARGSRLVLDL